MADYTPRPANTKDVRLPDYLSALTEQLAKNTHEVWARNRISEGWTLGEGRDDKQRIHPCLVPYEELSEIEKQYDRDTSLETLKVILALGYHIEPPEAYSRGENIHLNAIEQMLSLQSPVPFNELACHWQKRDRNIRPASPSVYQEFSRYLNKIGEYMVAYDVASEGLEIWEKDVILMQQLALALARTGDVVKSGLILDELVAMGNENEETYGLIARIYKDCWLNENRPERKKFYLSCAYDYYSMAYNLSDGKYWTGINAATLVKILGDDEKAMTLADRVYQECLRDLTGSDYHDQYWPLATLGEACLILDRPDEALDWYLKAVQSARGQYGNYLTTLKNALILLDHVGCPDDLKQRIRSCFGSPKIGVYVRDLEEPGWPKKACDPETEARLRKAILDALARHDIKIGFASIESFFDILFHECIVEQGGRSFVVLPYNWEELHRDLGCRDNGRPEYCERAERVFQNASEIVFASYNKIGNEKTMSEYSNIILHGEALNRSRMLQTGLVPIVFAAGDLENPHCLSVPEPGKFWKNLGIQFETIPFSGITFEPDKQVVRSCESGDSSVIHAILFADVTKFSRLKEPQLKIFVNKFLGAIGKLISESSHQPVYKNTWGDGLYMVFEKIIDAGIFALDLCDLVNSYSWSEEGLSDETSIRIALHVGPVLPCIDPITEESTFVGTHVSRAARLEPITPPGQVYTSRQFASISASLDIREFRCEYVGHQPFPKGYGTYDIFHLKRQA